MTGDGFLLQRSRMRFTQLNDPINDGITNNKPRIWISDSEFTEPERKNN